MRRFVSGFKNGRCCYFPLKGIHVSHCFATPVVSYRLKRKIFPMYPLVSIKPWSKEGILKMHSGHFMMIVWLRITQVMREETRCRLVVISSKESSICIIKQRFHGLCHTSYGALAKTIIRSMNPPRGIVPTTHCIMSQHSTT